MASKFTGDGDGDRLIVVEGQTIDQFQPGTVIIVQARWAILSFRTFSFFF
jgi:phosphomannomutase